MANLTLTLDDEVLRRARIRAIETGTSVNAVVRSYLEEFAGRTAAAEGAQEFLALSERAQAKSGPGGRAWTRDELHER